MPIIRNPFRRAPGDQIVDDNAKPTTYNASGVPIRRSDADQPTSKPTAIDLSSAEYKLSEINDSGVYLPPSPHSEAQSFWSLKPSNSRRSSHNNHRNALNENEPFNISRESFDSYRRSFDISARSPVLESSPSHRSRQSLEARNLRFPSTHSFSTVSFTSMRSGSLSQHPSQRSVTTLSTQYTADAASSTPEILETLEDRRPIRPTLDPIPAVPEPETTDRFDEVTLHDPKPRRGMFSRFGLGSSSNSAATSTADTETRSSTGSGHGFFGRKRGGSGQGAELGNMIRRPASRGPQAIAGAAVPEKEKAGLVRPSTPSKTDKIGGMFTRPKTPMMPGEGTATRPRTPLPAAEGAAMQPEALTMAGEEATARSRKPSVAKTVDVGAQTQVATQPPSALAEMISQPKVLMTENQPSVQDTSTEATIAPTAASETTSIA